MDDARHFFPFLPVAFGLGIAIYFVWPSEPGFYLHDWAHLAVSRAKPRSLVRSCGHDIRRPVVGRQPTPDVHILGEAYQLAWRTPSGDMAVMHEKRAEYETDIWRRRLGWPRQVGDVAHAACRFPACRIELQAGAELALVTDARHLSAACGSVDIVIAPYIRARYPCSAYLIYRRVLKPFATTLVYVERTQSGLHIFTRIPQANAMRVWQRSGAQSP